MGCVCVCVAVSVGCVCAGGVDVSVGFVCVAVSAGYVCVAGALVTGFGASPWAFVASLWIGFEGWLFGGLTLLGPPAISFSKAFFVL